MPRSQAVEQLNPIPEKRGVAWWIKVFVFIHLVAITCWALPRPPEKVLSGEDKLELNTATVLTTARSAGRNISDGTLLYNDRILKQSPLKYYLLFTGFWQYWDMFSPNPSSTDFYGTAEITYKDGHEKLYTFPRMFTMGISEKYVSERYRKFYERAHLEETSWLWPTFAQRIALINYSDPNNPPVQVVLTRHWMPIAPPGEPQKPDYKIGRAHV